MSSVAATRTGLIDGVRVAPRCQLTDERGAILHMLRRDDPEFIEFGEVYFSTVNPGIVKGWHLHKKMTLNYTCPEGEILLVLYDDRPESATRGALMELTLSREHHCLVQVPPLVWNGFVGMAPSPSVVCNCATLPHDPEEIVRLPYDDPSIPYRWPDIRRQIPD
jgi:dTDP-4-dehydrorhamnose 3,5-epimerase